MNVFVTGGSRGIGHAIVLKMVSQGNGCAFTYVKNKAAAAETLARTQKIDASIPVRAYQMDLLDPAVIEETCDKAIKEFNDIHVVINNAAIVRNNAAVLMSNKEWLDVINADLSGPFYIIRSFLMHFISNKFGRIVNISSLAQDGSSGQINYAAAKAGLLGITRTIAKEYATKGITCNAVTVGYVETDMTREHMSNDLHDFWLLHCPAKRIGSVDEVANLVNYLISNEASFVNGEVIHVSGGLTYAP